MVPSSTWFVYIIENVHGHWYTGITNDVERRLSQHQLGKGAKALRGKGPLQLVFSAPVADKRTAARLEYAIKRWPRARKAQLVAGEISLDQCLSDFSALSTSVDS